MKTKKSGIVTELKARYKERLSRAVEQLAKDYAKGRHKNGREYFWVDVELFHIWAYRVRRDWYGFALGNVPYVWKDILNDFLLWLQSQCPDFEILQAKVKMGGLRLYIETNSQNSTVNKKVRIEIQKLETLLSHENLRY
jgi:hypothetical protein